MQSLILFFLLTPLSLGQVDESTRKVAALIQVITPETPRRTGKGFEYLQYESRMREPRFVALVELGTLGTEAAPAVPLLASLIVDKYEPHRCKIAMIDALVKIGPASKSAIPELKQLRELNRGGPHRIDSGTWILSFAAERAMAFIESKPDEQSYRDLLLHLYPLLLELSVAEDSQTLNLVYDYCRRRNHQSSDKVVHHFESVIVDSRARLNLIVKLLQNDAGRDLGRILLNSSFVDGRTIVKQLLGSGVWPYGGEICLENLEGKETVVRQILEDSATAETSWQTVFRLYKAMVASDRSSGKQDRLAEIVTWLREVAKSSSRRSAMAIDWLMEPEMVRVQEGPQKENIANVAMWIREHPSFRNAHRHFALEWLFNLWRTEYLSESDRQVVIETARYLLDSTTSGEESILLANRMTPVKDWMQFVAQLLPDFRVSDVEREQIAQQLMAISQGNATYLRSVEKLLISRIREKRSPTESVPSSLVEQFLTEGRFAEGELALKSMLDANPNDDEARFGLGMLQLVRAVEDLGKALYGYGALSGSTLSPLLKLSVPRNRSPSPITYHDLGQVLDTFEFGLCKAESTLAQIHQDDVKLNLRLAKIFFDFTGTGIDQTALTTLLSSLNEGRPIFSFANREYRVHFDRADVAWLRAYCHLLSAIVDSYRALDLEAVFPQAATGIFPKVKSSREDSNRSLAQSDLFSLVFADASRMQSMRLHLLAFCELNREAWFYIGKESDDDFEWLASPAQTDLLLLSLSSRLVETWLTTTKQLERLLKGEQLVPSTVFTTLTPNRIEEGQGLNLKKWLDDPPTILISQGQLHESVLDAKYFEQMADQNSNSVWTFFQMFQLLQGRLGFAHTMGFE